MASTSAGVRLLEEIEALFSWNPDPLIPAPKPASPATPSGSGSIRPSEFYDKHLTPQLVLKKVQQLPSLLQDLAGVADKALEAALDKLPPLEKRFPTAEQRESDSRTFKVDTVVADEKGVSYFYSFTVAIYCACVASTLALHPSSSNWTTILSWSPSTGLFSRYANWELRIIGKGNEKVEIEWSQIMETMDSKDRAIFEGLRKEMRPLVTWEMMSLNTGSPEVMTAIHNLGQFSQWTRRDCSSKHVDIAKEVKQASGPDALAPPWQIPENPDKDIDIEPQVTQSAAASMLPPPLLGPTTRRVTRSATASRRLMPTPPRLSGSWLSEDEPSTIAKGKKRKREENEGERAFQDGINATAQRIVQLVWGQAVRADGTMIVLHSGNQELVCIRHRETQTLYVSDIIEPSTCSDPGYGKLQIGIYIATIQDTLDRRRQLRPESKSPDDGGDLISGKDQDDQDIDHGSGKGAHGHRKVACRGGHRSSSKRTAGMNAATDNKLVAIKKAIDVARNRNVVLLYLKYGIYNSVNPASFLRCPPSIVAHKKRRPTPSSSSRDISSYGLEECLTIVLTSEIGCGATGIVHRGTLKLELYDSARPLDIVVKLAFDSQQRDALRNEYKVYCLLNAKGVHKGIATALGLFDDIEGCACALVLLYAGVSLSNSQGNFSNSDCKSALSTLKSIHRAGILHGDIRRANIVIGDLGVTIIDFGHSEQCDNQGAKDRELTRLRGCLRLESKD